MKIFLNYRRQDSQPFLERLYDRLARDLPSDTVFRDVDSILPGVDFTIALRRAASECDVMLVLIGEHWLNISTEGSRRRIDEPDDFVRIEIETALEHRVPIIPVLVADARIPAADELPATIQGLSFKQAAHLRHDPDFHRDVDRLLRAIESLVQPIHTPLEGNGRTELARTGSPPVDPRSGILLEIPNKEGLLRLIAESADGEAPADAEWGISDDDLVRASLALFDATRNREDYRHIFAFNNLQDLTRIYEDDEKERIAKDALAREIDGICGVLFDMHGEFYEPTPDDTSWHINFPGGAVVGRISIEYDQAYVVEVECSDPELLRRIHFPRHHMSRFTLRVPGQINLTRAGSMIKQIGGKVTAISHGSLSFEVQECKEKGISPIMMDVRRESGVIEFIPFAYETYLKKFGSNLMAVAYLPMALFLLLEKRNRMSV